MRRDSRPVTSYMKMLCSGKPCFLDNSAWWGRWMNFASAPIGVLPGHEPVAHGAVCGGPRMANVFDSVLNCNVQCSRGGHSMAGTYGVLLMGHMHAFS